MDSDKPETLKRCAVRGGGRHGIRPALAILAVAVSMLLGALPSRAASHSEKFSEFQGTATCISCHREQAKEVFTSTHYQWGGNAAMSQGLDSAWAGKLGGINDFCIFPDINFIGVQTTATGETTTGGCAKCHAGLGQKPQARMTEEQLENIDCLMCHSDSYKRKTGQTDKGLRYVPDEAAMGMTITEAAQDIHRPTNASCLRCHTHAGGGDNFKRGDLSRAQLTASRDLDVHLASKAAGGAGLSCTDCHATRGHRIPGRGTDMRQADSPKQVNCFDCHGRTPHQAAGAVNGSRLDRHTARINCTVCHIPALAKAAATDMHRDYSAAPELNGSNLYEPHMVFQTNVTPEYAFFNGASEFYQFGNPAVEGSGGRVVMSRPLGAVGQAGSRIHAFKHHLAEQPRDPVTKRLIPLKMGYFFQTGDLDGAAQKGVEAVGWDWNGLEFASTERYMGIFHEVQPASKALACASCHGGGRMDFAALGYTPKLGGRQGALCLSCHGREDDNPSFTSLHKEHVDDKKQDCSKCHDFTAATQPSSNSLRVTLNPEGVEAGGAWSLDGGENWLESGTVVQGLRAGTYQVSFKLRSGLIAPPAGEVVLPQAVQTEVGGFYSLHAALKYMPWIDMLMQSPPPRR